MDYGTENTTHDKDYFDEIDQSQRRDEFLDKRTREISEQILADDHFLYSIADCIEEHIYNNLNRDELTYFNDSLVMLMGRKNSHSIRVSINMAVEKQARILAEGELAAMENEDDC